MHHGISKGELLAWFLQIFHLAVPERGPGLIEQNNYKANKFYDSSFLCLPRNRINLALLFPRISIIWELLSIDAYSTEMQIYEIFTWNLAGNSKVENIWRRTSPTTLLQIFWKKIPYSEFIIKSIIDPDDNFRRNSNGLKK